MKDYQLLLTRLFEEWSGENAENMIQLAPSGSDRRYFRLQNGARTAIGAYNADQKENKAFLTFSRHFFQKGLPVPEIYAENLDQGIYLQEDLGDVPLFQMLPRTGEPFGDELTQWYRQSLEQLARLQILGGEGLDYSVCYPREAFDRQSMLWDLNYFKHYFLKLAKIPFDEQLLEDDFNRLADYLLKADTRYFLFRDFQSRNIMLKNNKVYFIDYQGGRRGALQYDVASLLFQAKGNIPASIRESLLQHYLDAASQLTPIDRGAFIELYYGYVLIRSLQTLGAYGFRGLYERKEHFLNSIPQALQNIRELKDSFLFTKGMPELHRCLDALAATRQFDAYDRTRGANSPLVVSINSFSYRSGIPVDTSTNGGGFVFDCRFIFNPGRQDTYKHLTGRDEPVIQFLRQQTHMEQFLQSVFAIVDRAVENYIERDFESLQINFGCTGGQHRSVYAAESTARHLQEKYGANVRLCHIEQEKKGWKNG